MYINQSKKFDEKAGEWCILGDFLSEGLSVLSQHKTAEEAIKNLDGGRGCNQTIVRLVNFNFTVGD